MKCENNRYLLPCGGPSLSFCCEIFFKISLSSLFLCLFKTRVFYDDLKENSRGSSISSSYFEPCLNFFCAGLRALNYRPRMINYSKSRDTHKEINLLCSENNLLSPERLKNLIKSPGQKPIHSQRPMTDENWICFVTNLNWSRLNSRVPKSRTINFSN